MQYLREVLETLVKKLFFDNLKVEYLGHLISQQGVAMDTKKVEAILKWSIPKSVMALRGFLGLAGYYRRFIAGYGKMARPLTNMLKKGNFLQTNESASAFEQLKKAISSTLVLTMPDFSQPFSIECDASGKGIGVVLSQNRKAITFSSKPLS